jgi:hypothetical protein
MKTVLYRVEYYDNDNEYKETHIEVPAWLPDYDPNDEEDVPLYIKATIEDLFMLEHFEEAAE